jgi:UDP-4-amino-4,6-dideoxy-N-acetyl-beta-L-altrosamine transaminase
MIPYGRQSINEDDVNAVISALKSDFLTTGPLVELFEANLESIVGAPCVAVSSGTAALHCAYAAIELQPGDEVITPPLTFIATQATAAMFGAKIVFADIQSDTGNIDPDAVSAGITSKTKAIVAVDFAGHPAELEELRLIANRHGIYLIEDAAHSLGSTYQGRPVGSIADITTFSFFPTKNITTCEGGAVASPRPDLLLKARRFSRQGLIRSEDEFRVTTEGKWHQEVHGFGLNYRLPDVLCALGSSQLKRLEEFKRRRREIFAHYSTRLAGTHGITLPSERAYVSTNWHLFPIRVRQENRESLFNSMRKEGIGVQVNYFPAHLQPVFQRIGFKVGDFPEAESYYSQEISIPMHVNLSDSQIERISEFIILEIEKSNA